MRRIFAKLTNCKKGRGRAGVVMLVHSKVTGARQSRWVFGAQPKWGLPRERDKCRTWRHQLRRWEL